MQLLICLFLFLSYSFHFQILAAAHQSRCKNQAELSALLHFKDEFVINCTNPYGDNLGYPKTSSWKNGAAEWEGVECDPITGHVIVLDLSSSCLHGSSSSSIFSLLAHLEHLNLAFNDFSGSSIPSEVGNLSRLSYLNLSYSYFDGRVPLEISKLSMLTSLDLSYNSWGLDMNLKSLAVWNLTNLEELDLSGIYINSEVPKWLFTNMSSLRSLNLDHCGLKGEFPQGIFHLPKLQLLSIQGNRELEGHLPTDFNSSTTPLLESLVLMGTNFSGTIPVSIGNLVLLRDLVLSYCKFSGHIPVSLGKLTNLRYLNIPEANLIGEIPHSLANLTHLTNLDLSYNQLSGHIPSVLANLTQLSEVSLANNQLRGEIPPGLFNLTKLLYLDVSNNTLRGPLPIQNLRNLKYLSVSDNKLSGTLDLGMFLEFINLTRLLLSSNNLTLLHQRNLSTNSTLPSFEVVALSSCRISMFPEFLRHQPNLLALDLSFNSIEGPIPSWIGSIKYLRYIDLSYNFITGLNDQHLFLRLPYLENLDISSNKLQGSIPVLSPSVLTYRASNNELTGEIPRSIFNLTSLHVLDFSSNSLTGELDPYCFSQIYLVMLNLQNNSFHGNIPEFCTNRTGYFLTMIDLKYNQFQGKIPRSLADCIKLEFFDVGSNLISDTFPYWLGSLPHLKVMIMRENALRGSIGMMSNMRSEYWFPELTIIDVSHNSLSGNLTSWNIELWIAMKTSNLNNPSYMGQYVYGYTLGGEFYDYSLTMNNKGTERDYPKILDVLVAIDLSSNEFKGEIPTIIGDLQGLRSLNISNNHLSGGIPSSLGNLKKLESLDLSSNMLYGQIPQELTGLNFLSAFDVSHNNLTGLIPCYG